MAKIKAVTVHGGHNPQGKIACGHLTILTRAERTELLPKR